MNVRRYIPAPDLAMWCDEQGHPLRCVWHRRGRWVLRVDAPGRWSLQIGSARMKYSIGATMISLCVTACGALSIAIISPERGTWNRLTPEPSTSGSCFRGIRTLLNTCHCYGRKQRQYALPSGLSTSQIVLTMILMSKSGDQFST